jgi:hypothetical protein
LLTAGIEAMLQERPNNINGVLQADAKSSQLDAVSRLPKSQGMEIVISGVGPS